MGFSNDTALGRGSLDPWAAGIASRLSKLSPDERLVLERLLARIEKGRETYGPMDLANDPRNLAAEAEPEADDWFIYRSMLAVQQRQRDAAARPANEHEQHNERACLCEVTPCPCRCHGGAA